MVIISILILQKINFLILFNLYAKLIVYGR